MMMDVVYVTYNSEKWVEKCFTSWLQTDYDLKQVNIIIVDNNSADTTVPLLKNISKKYKEKFASIKIILEDKNLGFGKANNIGFREGDSDIVCFFNIDTELFPDTLTNLQQEIEESEDEVALWELRQFPYEHPKLYDPLTGYTSWSSGAAFAMRRDIYDKLGGFDEQIFMYAEDVDLSWRIRSFGYKLKYVPKATIMHYAYSKANEIKPNQYVNSIINNLLLRYRFAGLRTVIEGHLRVWKCIMGEEVFEGSRKMLLKAYIGHFFRIMHFKNKKNIGTCREFQPTFLGFDYAPIRDGAFYYNEFPHTNPLISVIVRTCGRPAILRETLISLRKQTYKNLEIVIVEDGEPISEKMIHEEFVDLNIVYQASGEKIGRSRAGNLAMSLAHGKYLNFLDDDDLFYADHVEVLVHALESVNCKAAYSFGFETPIEVFSKDPYKYEVKNYYGVHKQAFDKIILCHHNYIPIQCIMFEKALFDEYGGLDETVDALEDWDLWVRYSQYTDFKCIEKTTSIYRVPYDRQINKRRQKELDNALVIMRNKHKKYVQNASAYDLACLYDKIK